MKPELTFETASTLAVVAAVLCLATPVRSAAQSAAEAEGVYADEGPLVSLPADGAGALARFVTGSAFTLACTPFDFAIALARRDVTFGATAAACGSQAGDLAGGAAYFVAGVPFFAVKKLLWDAPRRAVGDG